MAVPSGLNLGAEMATAHAHPLFVAPDTYVQLNNHAPFVRVTVITMGKWRCRSAPEVRAKAATCLKWLGEATELA